MFSKNLLGEKKEKYFLPNRILSSEVSSNNKVANGSSPDHLEQRQRALSQTASNRNSIQSLFEMPAHGYNSFVSNNTDLSFEQQYDSSPQEGTKQFMFTRERNSQPSSDFETPEKTYRSSLKKREGMPSRFGANTALTDRAFKFRGQYSNSDDLTLDGKVSTPLKRLSAGSNFLSWLTSAEENKKLPGSPSTLDIMFAKHWRSFSVPMRSHQNSNKLASETIHPQNPWVNFVKQYCSKGSEIVNLIKQGKDYQYLLDIKKYLHEKVHENNHVIFHKPNNIASQEFSPSRSHDVFGDLKIQPSSTLPEAIFQRPMTDKPTVTPNGKDEESNQGQKYETFEDLSFDMNERDIETSTVIESSSRRNEYPLQAGFSLGRIDASSDNTNHKESTLTKGFALNEESSKEIKLFYQNFQNPKISLVTKDELKRDDDSQLSPMFKQDSGKNSEEVENSLQRSDSKKTLEQEIINNQSKSALDETTKSFQPNQLSEELTQNSKLQNKTKAVLHKSSKSQEIAKKSSYNAMHNDEVGDNTKASQKAAGIKPSISSNSKDNSNLGSNSRSQAVNFNQTTESRPFEGKFMDKEEQDTSNIYNKSMKKGTIYVKISLLSPKHSKQNQGLIKSTNAKTINQPIAKNTEILNQSTESMQFTKKSPKKLVYVTNYRNKTLSKADASKYESPAKNSNSDSLSPESTEKNDYQRESNLSQKSSDPRYHFSSFAKSPLRTAQEFTSVDQVERSSDRNSSKRVSFNVSSETT